ncbi:MAG TPA: PVC-type heme-binding CxxCH protein [Isosphaeraceae bacterium]|jgi:quinoprotein glucose dehydrogenase|nr:PVC-type heme-binding CxxCH protein [Isosphaeraceae bacterium]
MPGHSVVRTPAALLGMVAFLVVAPSVEGKQQGGAKAYDPPVAGASEEGARAIGRFKGPKGVKVELFAAEPLVANPVAFGFDEKGRVFVAESFRHGAGVEDIRGHMDWLAEDLACRTVEDRVAMFRRHMTPEAFAAFAVEHDRLRLVEDADGDGKADKATVFADGFNTVATGIGAGVLARRGEVWYACIPDLWRLKDTNGDGKADVRDLLHHGYGVHIAFLGHDLHGLKFGPDGLLYFTVGDRALNVRTKDKGDVTYLDAGAVLRCEPDGSNLEIVAVGLRNPQELAFNEYGDLFTCDNNSDGGDRARWVHLVEGGDSGWRIGYQTLEYPNSRGPWNSEKLWHPAPANTAAYLLPPLINVSDGPSGLAYDPGVTRLPDRYRHRFFLADFRGGSGQSGVRSLALKPKGASFEVVESEQFLWGVLATDVDFGPDGALYVLDWVEGWSKPNKGRIYRVADPAKEQDAAVAEVHRLIAEGMADRPLDDLAKLLAHADQRVRQEAQFALASKGPEAVATLARVAGSKGETLARLHAVWGLGQVARADPKAIVPVRPLLADGDAEVRAQSARVLGDRRDSGAAEGLIKALKDESARVRFQAAIALGKLARPGAVAPVLAMLRENGDTDAYLRHAGVMALAGIGDRAALRDAASDPDKAVRLGALLALRRLRDGEVARFLDDKEPGIVLEAARAINDVPIEAGLPRLADLLAKPNLPAPLARRALNASFRLGRPENARALAEFALRGEEPRSARVEAIDALGEWGNPPGRDRVVGLWRPLPARPPTAAVAALTPSLRTLLGPGPDDIRLAAARASARLGIRDAGPALLDLVNDDKAFGSTRAEALKALEANDDPRLAEAVRVALASDSDTFRSEGRRVLAKVDPVRALRDLETTLTRGTKVERQKAFATIATINDPAADVLFARWLDRLQAGRVDADMQLDLLDAAARRAAPEVKDRLARFEAARSKGDTVARYREVLQGGDSRRGMRIFNQKAEVSCLRCHKVRGPRGEPFGGEVGPDLTGIGAKQSRDYVLESMVDPNAKIAQGFETVVLATDDGQVITGVLRSEDDKAVHLITAEGKVIDVPKSTIEERKRGQSAMPADLAKHLSKAELRDLVEYLANLKQGAPVARTGQEHGN